MLVLRSPGCPRAGRPREHRAWYLYDAEDTVCLRLKTSAAAVGGEPLATFDYVVQAHPRQDGELIIETDTSVEFSVWRGEVRFGAELDALFTDLLMRVFEERYDAENEDAEADRLSAVTAI